MSGDITVADVLTQGSRDLPSEVGWKLQHSRSLSCGREYGRYSRISHEIIGVCPQLFLTGETCISRFALLARFLLTNISLGGTIFHILFFRSVLDTYTNAGRWFDVDGSMVVVAVGILSLKPSAVVVVHSEGTNPAHPHNSATLKTASAIGKRRK